MSLVIACYINLVVLFHANVSAFSGIDNLHYGESRHFISK